MKSLINTPLLKEQLKRFWAIGAVLILFYVLAGMLPLIAQMLNPYNPPHHIAQDIVSLLSMSHPIPIIAMVAGPFFAAMALYPYSFSSSAATTFLSFPLSKRQLYYTNLAAALVLMLLPLLIFCLFLLIPIRYHGGQSWVDAHGVTQFWRQYVHFPEALFPCGVRSGAVINTLPVVAGFFMRIAVGSLFYFMVFLLAVSVSGTRLIAVLLCGALPLLPAGFHLLAEGIATVYVFGYDGIHDTRLAYTFLYSNPVMWGSVIEDFSRSFIRFRLLAFPFFPEASAVVNSLFIVYIAITAALGTIAYYCSNWRKQERTGDSVVFTSLKNILIFLLSLMGSIGMGPFLMMLTRSRAGLYLGFIIGFVIAYFIAQMIAEKTFSIGHKIKSLLYFGGTMIGVYLMMLLFTNVLMLPYINRVPQAHEIAGVSLSHHWRWMGLHERPFIYADDHETIALTLQKHQLILNNRRYLRRVFWQAGSRSQPGPVHTIPITYLFHDGTTMYRSYLLSRDFMISSGIGKFVNSPPIILAQHPILNQSEIIDTVRITTWDDRSGRETVSTVTGRENIRTLFDAVKNDLTAGAALDWYITAGGQEPPDWQRRWFSLDIRLRQELDEQYRQYRRTTHISFGSYTNNTLLWLRERGYM